MRRRMRNNLGIMTRLMYQADRILRIVTNNLMIMRPRSTIRTKVIKRPINLTFRLRSDNQISNRRNSFQFTFRRAIRIQHMVRRILGLLVIKAKGSCRVIQFNLFNLYLANFNTPIRFPFSLQTAARGRAIHNLTRHRHAIIREIRLIPYMHS